MTPCTTRIGLRLLAAASLAALSCAASSGVVGIGPPACDTGASCQPPDQMGHGAANIVATISDLNPGAGFTVRENFRPLGNGFVTDLCWWGVYVDFVAQGDCGPGPGDDFIVSYYLDVNGAPGPQIANFLLGPAPSVPTGNQINTGFGPINEFEYSAPHPPVEILGGECYWIEIANNTVGDCVWLWSTSPDGDARSEQGGLVLDYDHAVCVGVDIEPDGCAPAPCQFSEDTIDITILTDLFPQETTWEVTNGLGHPLCTGGPYGIATALFEEQCCVPAGSCWRFTIIDQFGDGICCGGAGDGNYEVRLNGQPVCSGGEFDFEETCSSPFCPDDFEAPREFLAEGEAINEAVGDINGDGFVDVVALLGSAPGPPSEGGVAGPMTGSVQVFTNNGNGAGGTWMGLTALAAVPVGGDPSDVTLGDFDGDSDLDVAVSNEGDGTVSILLNNGSAIAPLDPPFTIGGGTLMDPTSITAARLNGDAFDDFAVTDSGLDMVVVFLNDATGSAGFDPPVQYMAATDPGTVDPEDWDEDKDPDDDIDLFVANEGSNSVSFLYNDGAGGFSPPSDTAVGTMPSDLGTDDFDGDGVADAVTSDFGDDTVTILLNDGNGTFSFSSTVSTGDMPRSVEAADLTNDRDPDLAVVAIDPVEGPAVQVFFESGGGFLPPDAYTVDAIPNYVLSADFNKDCLLDLVTSNTDPGPTGGSVTVLLNVKCVGDTNGDDAVDIDDVIGVILDFGTDGTANGGDADCSGTVDIDDVVIVVLAFGSC